MTFRVDIVDLSSNNKFICKYYIMIVYTLVGKYTHVHTSLTNPVCVYVQLFRENGKYFIDHTNKCNDRCEMRTEIVAPTLSGFFTSCSLISNKITIKINRVIFLKA